MNYKFITGSYNFIQYGSLKTITYTSKNFRCSSLVV